MQNGIFILEETAFQKKDLPYANSITMDMRLFE